MIYIYLTFFLFLSRYFIGRFKLNLDIFYYLIFFTLFIFVSFRYEVGCDWATYEGLFYNTDQYEWFNIFDHRDPFFWLINGLLNKLNFSFLALNIVLSGIFFLGIHKLAKFQPDPLGFLILIFPILIVNMPMSGIRQSAAIGLICIAFIHFIEHRPIKFSTWVLIASGFHLSAIVFMALIPFSSGRYNNTRLAISIIMILPSLIFIYFSEGASIAIKTYVGAEVEAYGAAFRVSILTLSAIYFFLCVKEKWKKTYYLDYSLVSLGSIGMVLLFLIVPFSSVISDRFGYYLIPIQAMIFARLPFLPFKKNHYIHVILPYLGMFIVFCVWALTSWHFQKCYMPYDNWLFVR